MSYAHLSLQTQWDVLRKTYGAISDGKLHEVVKNDFVDALDYWSGESLDGTEPQRLERGIPIIYIYIYI